MEQLTLDFNVSATQRHRKAKKLAELDEQPTLFASWSPNLDIHLHDPQHAVVVVSGSEPERASHWLAGVLGGDVQTTKPKRLLIPAAKLDRLLAIRPPAQVTLDAASSAVAKALWAHSLGLRPLRVRREGQRLFADSPRWPTGLRIKDAPWTTIATLSHLGIPLDVEQAAKTLFARRLTDAGAKIAAAGLAGSAVLIKTSRPEMVEGMGLPGLAYAGEPRDGNYKLPLLSSAPLLHQPLIDIPDDLAKAIHKATDPTRPLTKKQIGDGFPWTLFDFQATDAGRALRILETTGGVLLAGDMGSGKAVHVDQLVLTPSGLRPAGQVKAGDELIGRDGTPTTVLGAYPQGTRATYTVTFTDGTTARVDGEHLWTVAPSPAAASDPDTWLTLSTQQLAERALHAGNGAPIWYLPMASAVRFHQRAPLPDPYALGSAIALGSATPTSARHRHASVAERSTVLRALLDACADVPAGASEGLVVTRPLAAHTAAEVTWLVETLGGTARRSHDHTHTGTQALDIRLPADVAPFQEHTKAARYSELPHTEPTRAFASIEPSAPGQTICFKVDAPDALFLLDHAICTHNTTVSLALANTMSTWPLLVVAPLSAFSTWARQLGEMGRSFYLATETPARSWETIESGQHEAVVISYDRLPAFLELVERMQFKALIADEIQRTRTPGSKRSRALRALAASIPIRIGLSGTPVTNTLSDILSVGAALAPGEWRPRANTKDLADMYPGDPVEAIAEHLGSLMVRRRIDQVGRKMPKRNDHRVYVTMTQEQRQAIAGLEAEAQAAKESGEFDGPNGKFNALVKLARMRQIIANPRSAGVGGPNPKIEQAVRIIKDFTGQGRKGVIFTVDRASFQDLGRELDIAGIRWGGIWGSTPPLERIEVERRLHRGQLDVVICTIAAGAESWTASPTATYCLFLSYVWAPASLAQAEARVYRLNSDVDGPSIEILYLHATGIGGAKLGGPDAGEDAAQGSIDDRMVEVLEQKRALFAQVVDRSVHQDTTQVHTKLSDLLFVLTGQKDEGLIKREKDAQAVVAAEKAKKKHAVDTLYARKGRNKTKASVGKDDGSTTLTLEQYRSMGDVVVDDLVEDLDLSEDDDIAFETAAFDAEDE